MGARPTLKGVVPFQRSMPVKNIVLSGVAAGVALGAAYTFAVAAPGEDSRAPMERPGQTR